MKEKKIGIETRGRMLHRNLYLGYNTHFAKSTLFSLILVKLTSLNKRFCVVFFSCVHNFHAERSFFLRLSIVEWWRKVNFRSAGFRLIRAFCWLCGTAGREGLITVLFSKHGKLLWMAWRNAFYTVRRDRVSHNPGRGDSGHQQSGSPKNGLGGDSVERGVHFSRPLMLSTLATAANINNGRAHDT